MKVERAAVRSGNAFRLSNRRRRPNRRSSQLHVRATLTRNELL